MKKLFIISCLVVFCSSYSVMAQSGIPNLFISEDTEFAKPNDEGFYGEPFDLEEDPMSWKDVEKKIRKFDGAEGSIRGTVNEICQAKGCWLSLNADGQDYFVKFKDYAFFLPRDIAGKEVILHGVAFYETTSVDELRHYAEDAGKTEDEIAEITEPLQELKIMADGGVVLDGE